VDIHTDTPVPAPVVPDTHSGVQRADTPPAVIPKMREWKAPSNSLVDLTEPDIPVYWYNSPLKGFDSRFWVVKQ
jgi:hypothetical protein